MGIQGFASPAWFLLLAAVGAIAAGYVLVQRMRRRHLLRFANLDLLDKVAPKRPGRGRHVPAVLFVVAFVVLIVGLAGPVADAKVPRNRAVVMLVIDVSLSMQATDISPSRIESAKASAKSFVDGMTPGINLGLETFGGTATIVVTPTTDRKPVEDGIDNLKLDASTATGDAIAAALQAIEQFGRIVPGGPPPARIVLMSDGKQTTGRDEFEAAKLCAEANVPVSTISFGTTDGTITLNGRLTPVPVDDDSLHRVADLSGGQFYKADSGQKLQEIYDTLGQQIGYETTRRDTSKPYFAIGAILSLTAAATALLITQRLP
jgi:Ca-activated chloride channel family protein